MVRPLSATLRTPSMIILAERASRPLVGSSRKSTLGCAASSTPIVKRFICSTELPRMIWSAMSCTAVLYWINMSLFMLMQTYMGQFFAYLMPNLEVADVLGLLASSIYILFMGFNPPANEIPSGYTWLYDIIPYRYSIGIMGALVFADCDDMPTWDEATVQYTGVGSQLGCQPVTNTPVSIDHITVKAFVETVFNLKHDDIWRNFGIVLVFIVVFRILGLLALRFVNHQKK